MEDLYLDGFRYTKKDAVDLIEFITQKIRSRVKFKIIKLKNSIKLNIQFRSPIMRSKFIQQWNHMKMSAPFLYKGVSRWKFKPRKFPRINNVIPRDRRGKKKKEQNATE
ncbi:hypothetical protein OXYTRIMIC_370 [Oxytricha trifallax]|uniref:Uncharacterized protein n=1 Tax=Oxytricha trifallax TaxID=1172189 RepID=A0A073I0A7_9SPIT|nr:hypothetical protein OXYTRIMIC_370 [Oxytricha trifallax]